MSEVNAMAGFFLGIGLMAVFFVGAYLLYQIAKMYRNLVDKEARYDMVEVLALEKVANKKGYDLEREILKRSVLRNKERKFRDRLQDEMYDEMFGKNKK